MSQQQDIFPFLEKLLDGVKVEWKPLGEVAKLITTGRLNANAREDNGVYPFFTCNKEPYRINSYQYDLEAILISGNGSQVGHLNYYKGKFNAYQRTYILGEFDNIHVMYLYHYLSSTLKSYIAKNSKKGSIPYITKPMLDSFELPIPCPDDPEKSLDIQQKIVDILDKFTALIAAHGKELIGRKKQYAYYREQLLTFDQKEVPYLPLGEIATLKNGKDWKDLKPGDIPVYGSGGIMAHVDSFVYDQPTVLLPRKGTITNVFYVENPFWNIDTIYYTEIDTTQLIPKFFYYYMTTVDLSKLDTGSGRPSLTQAILNNINIPIPSLAEQERLVGILDKFETLTTSTSDGLPREIDLRQKQYEYYRDKLLSFPKTSQAYVKENGKP